MAWLPHFASGDVEKRWRERFVFIHTYALVSLGVNMRTQWTNIGNFLFSYYWKSFPNFLTYNCDLTDSVGKYNKGVVEEGSDERIEALWKLSREEMTCTSIFNLGTLITSFWLLSISYVYPNFEFNSTSSEIKKMQDNLKIPLEDIKIKLFPPPSYNKKRLGFESVSEVGGSLQQRQLRLILLLPGLHMKEQLRPILSYLVVLRLCRFHLTPQKGISLLTPMSNITTYCTKNLRKLPLNFKKGHLSALATTPYMESATSFCFIEIRKLYFLWVQVN